MEDEKRADFWRTMNKIRAASYRVGFNLWDLFLPLDESRTNLVSEQRFISLLLGPLKKIIGLDEKDVQVLVSFFKVPDGRVYYVQFCKLIHDEGLEGPKSEVEIKKIDPLAVNPLSYKDLRELQMMLTKIAVTAYEILEKPFTRDEWLIKNEAGLVTKTRFRQILSTHNAHLSSGEFLLLVRRYIEDGMTVRYKAFIKELQEIAKYLQDHGMLDLSGNLSPDWPGRSPEEPLPRPEVNPLPQAGVKTLTPDWGTKSSQEEILAIIQKIKDHSWSEKIRVGDFIKMYDPLSCGRVPEKLFRDGLVAFSKTAHGFNWLYLAEDEQNILCSLYADPYDRTRILWTRFKDDVEADFDLNELNRWPAERLHRDNEEFKRKKEKEEEKIERMRVPPSTIKSILSEIKRKAVEQKLLLRKMFGELAYKEHGYVSNENFNNILREAGFLLSDHEVSLLQEKYNCEEGMNYKLFLDDVDSTLYIDSKNVKKEAKKLEVEKKKEKETKKKSRAKEYNIVEVLGKVKKQLLELNVLARDLMEPLENMQENLVKLEDFQKAIENSKLNLSQTEISTIIDVFSQSTEPKSIDVEGFCNCVDEPIVDVSKLKFPLEEMAKEKMEKRCNLPRLPFVNFQERQTLSLAINKLSRCISMKDFKCFHKMDMDECGLISKHTFIEVLQDLRALTVVTVRDIETIMTAFGLEYDLEILLDYTSFLKAVEIARLSRRV